MKKSGWLGIMKNTEANNIEIAVIDDRSIRDKIYEVRGMKVMLDFDLAEIYGYTTSAFNQQIKRNEERFPSDFRFQLTQEEIEILSKSQNVILNTGSGRGSNLKYLPWAFTESGIYMLMSVLRGDLAIQQSIALIRIFRAMKDYIVETQDLVSQRDLLRLSLQTNENTEAIRRLQSWLGDQQKIVAEHMKSHLHALIDQMKNNPVLLLR